MRRIPSLKKRSARNVGYFVSIIPSLPSPNQCILLSKKESAKRFVYFQIKRLFIENRRNNDDLRLIRTGIWQGLPSVLRRTFREAVELVCRLELTDIITRDANCTLGVNTKMPGS